MGVFWILAGLGIAAAVVGKWDIQNFIRIWWPLFIIVPCFLSVIKNGFGNASFIGLIIGILLLLNNQGIVEGYLIRKMLVPIILILIGMNLILRSVFNGSRKVSPENISKGDLEYASVFASQNIVYPPDRFYGAKVDAVFGSLTLDLRNAVIEDDIVIRASAVFGGVNLLVPSGIRVKIYSSSLFGGTDNKTNVQQPAATIYVDTSCMFGGVTVK